MTDDNHTPDFDEIDCVEAIGYLYAYLDGELGDKDSQKKFEHHLEHCKSCYSRAELEKAINKRLSTMKQGTAPESLQKRLRDLLDKL